jgi:hypothetical protein
MYRRQLGLNTYDAPVCGEQALITEAGEGHKKCAHTDLLRGRASGSFSGQKAIQKGGDMKIEMKSEIPGVSRVVVVRAGGAERENTQKARGRLGTRCGLACARCVRNDLSVTVRYSLSHVTQSRLHYIQYRTVSARPIGGDALVATGAPGHSRLSFALCPSSLDTIDRGPLYYLVRTGIASRKGPKVQRHFFGRSGPAYIPDLLDFPLHPSPTPCAHPSPPPTKRFIHSHDLRSLSSLRDFSPADWIALDSPLLPAGCAASPRRLCPPAAQLQNPLNSSRSATRLLRPRLPSSIGHRTSRCISRPLVRMSVCQE